MQSRNLKVGSKVVLKKGEYYSWMEDYHTKGEVLTIIKSDNDGWRMWSDTKQKELWTFKDNVVEYTKKMNIIGGKLC